MSAPISPGDFKRPKETASVVTIEVDPPAWPGHRAGQHLEVRVTADDGYQAEREYSIASAPGEPLAITVERLTWIIFSSALAPRA